MSYQILIPKEEYDELIKAKEDLLKSTFKFRFEIYSNRYPVVYEIKDVLYGVDRNISEESLLAVKNIVQAAINIQNEYKADYDKNSKMFDDSVKLSNIPKWIVKLFNR